GLRPHVLPDIKLVTRFSPLPQRGRGAGGEGCPKDNRRNAPSGGIHSADSRIGVGMFRRTIVFLTGLIIIGLALPGGISRTQERPKSYLIKGGTLIDGTGAKSRAADVRVVGDKIAEIGTLKPKAGEEVISAGGMVVAPGFIDTHSHADGGILEMPEAETQI